MKTKKIELLVALYGFLLYIMPALIIVVSVVLGFIFSTSTVCLVLLLIGTVVILYGELQLPRRLQKAIFQELLKGYQQFLTMQIARNTHWKYFPSKNDLSNWNSSYLGCLKDLSQKLWITNFHANHENSGQWKESLKDIYVPIKSIYNYTEKGVSLYDIETFDSFGLFPENAKELTLEQRKSLLFLKHLPLKDLQSCIERSLCLCFNEIVLGLLVLREGEGEKFEDFLEMVYSKKLHLCLTDDAISFLMKYAESIARREKKDFSVAKPLFRKILIFLAYYVGIKAESIKPTERKKLFDWYLEQQGICLPGESKLLLHWPKFTAEEIVTIKETLNDVDSMVIFANSEIWEELSLSHLRQILVEFSSPNPVFSWIKGIKNEKRFLAEIAKRLPEE